MKLLLKIKVDIMNSYEFCETLLVQVQLEKYNFKKNSAKAL